MMDVEVTMVMVGGVAGIGGSEFWSAEMCVTDNDLRLVYLIFVFTRPRVSALFFHKNPTTQQQTNPTTFVVLLFLPLPITLK